MTDYSDNDRNQDFYFFIDHYDELFKKYGHKFFVIRNKEILGIFDDQRTAIDETTKVYPLGTFIVQENTGDESGYTIRVNPLIYRYSYGENR